MPHDRDEKCTLTTSQNNFVFFPKLNHLNAKIDSHLYNVINVLFVNMKYAVTVAARISPTFICN